MGRSKFRTRSHEKGGEGMITFWFIVRRSGQFLVPGLRNVKGGGRTAKARDQGGGAEQQRPKTPYSVVASSLSPVIIGQCSAGS